MSGKISRKEISAYAATQHGPNFRGFADRTFVGANSAISFEELSASEKNGSVSSRNPHPTLRHQNSQAQS